MNLWIYPIGKNVYTFELKDGKILDGNIDSFKHNIVINNFPDETWWHVRNHYSKVEIGDNVYIYATKSNKNSGIVGYATVMNKRDKNIDEDKEDRKEIALTFNIEECKRLIANPIPLKRQDSPRSPLGIVSEECQKYISSKK